MELLEEEKQVCSWLFLWEVKFAYIIHLGNLVTRLLVDKWW